MPCVKNHYQINDFISSCSDQSKVIVKGKALKGAKESLNLLTSKEILDFLYYTKLEFKIENSCLLEKHNFDTNVMMDSYGFEYQGILMYMAFYKNPMTNCWILKSFKLNDKANRLFSSISIEI